MKIFAFEFLGCLYKLETPHWAERGKLRSVYADFLNLFFLIKKEKTPIKWCWRKDLLDLDVLHSLLGVREYLISIESPNGRIFQKWLWWSWCSSHFWWIISNKEDEQTSRIFFLVDVCYLNIAKQMILSRQWAFEVCLKWQFWPCSEEMRALLLLNLWINWSCYIISWSCWDNS